MKGTREQLIQEEQARKKIIDEIEKAHKENEDKVYRNELKVYQQKQSHYRIHKHIGKVRAVAHALTLTSKFHHHKHLSNIRMKKKFVNNDEFELLEKYFSNSLSSISENVRGEVTLPYAPVFLEKLKSKGSIFKTYNAPSDSYYKQNGRFKTSEEVERDLLAYSMEPAVEYKLKKKKAASHLWHRHGNGHGRSGDATGIKLSVTAAPAYTKTAVADRKERFKLKMSPLKKSRKLKYNTANFMNMDKFVSRTR
eukprot:g6168.t1